MNFFRKNQADVLSTGNAVATMDESKNTSSRTIERPAEILILAAWFGLLTGLGEICLLAIIKFFFHRFLFLSLHTVWAAPLVNVLLFSIAGLALFLAALRWPRLGSLRSAIFVFSFLSFLSLMFMYPRLHRFAALLLAAGLGTQAARILGAYPIVFHAIVRRTFGWILAVLVVLTVSIHGGWRLAEYRAQAKLPPAALDAPNVLLIVLDTVRAQNLSAYGYARPTSPQLELFGKAGVRFQRAISTAPWTLPGHAAMFTGRFPYELALNYMTPLDGVFPTLSEVFSEQGYATAGFVANTSYCGWESGLTRGFMHYEDFVVSHAELLRSSSLGRTVTNANWVRRATGNFDILGRKSAARINQDFLRWVSSNGERPFFAFLNYFDAHTPYLPPEPFAANFARQKRELQPWNGTSRKWLPEEVEGERDAYDGAIAYLDRHLGLLFDELRRRGLFEKTLIIVTADHGEEFHEHGHMNHGNSLYLPSLHVPLMIVFPSRVPAGQAIYEPVSIRDLPATVVDLLQLKPRVQFPGDTLARYWNGKSQSSSEAKPSLLSEATADDTLPSWYPASRGDMKSLFVDPYHYIKNGDGREELYDAAQDPLEQHDLSRAEKGPRLLERFRVSIDMMLKSSRSK